MQGHPSDPRPHRNWPDRPHIWVVYRGSTSDTVGRMTSSAIAVAARRRRLGLRGLLPVWFAVRGIGHLFLLGTDAIGVDTRIYYRGSAAWLAGGDPWQAFASYTVSYGTNYYHYAGFPPTVIAFAPLTLLPEGLAVALFVAVSLVAGAYIVRSLRLPFWWLLFPPLLEGMWAGDPGIVLLAFLLSGRAAAIAIAPVIKAYAGLPPFFEGRLKPLIVAAAIGVLMIALAPDLWRLFLGQSDFISRRLLSESAGGYAASAFLPLYLIAVPAVIGLILVHRKFAGWFAVIALWPASEFHYSAYALAALVRERPIVLAIAAAVLALPVQGLPVLVTAAIAALRVRAWFARRRGVAGAATASDTGEIAAPDDRPGFGSGVPV